MKSIKKLLPYIIAPISVYLIYKSLYLNLEELDYVLMFIMSVLALVYSILSKQQKTNEQTHLE